MRPVVRSPRAIVAGVLIAIVVIACSSPTAGSTAGPSAGAPSSTPAPSPVATASTVAVATPTAPGTPEPTQRTIQSPDPSFFDVQLECIGDEVQQCSLHRRNDVGVEAPGWPIELDRPVVDLAWNDFTIGCGDYREPIFRAGVDDLTFIGLHGPSGPEIHAFESWGLPAPGWPQPFPAPDGDCHGLMVSADGDHVIAWGYGGVEQDIELIADRTEFTMLDLRGRTVSGWPRGSEGAASGPVRFDDGIAYVSATGRVWAHDAAGEVRPGWGYRLMTKSAPMSDGSHLAVAQRVADVDDAVVVLGVDGKPLPGFPTAVNGELQTLCLYGDTPCAGDVGPTLAPDGTVYVALGTPRQGVGEHDPTGGRIEAYGPDGRMVDGWPVQLPEWGHVIDMGWSTEGAVIATVVICGSGGCGTDDQYEEHWYGMDGRLIQVYPIEAG
jgi:hypothetical protein